MTERVEPPSARELALFDAAIHGSPQDFVSSCRRIGKDSKFMLDAFDLEPWRWSTQLAPAVEVIVALRTMPFPPWMRKRLDSTRRYVETPRWRRVFGLD